MESGGREGRREEREDVRERGRGGVSSDSSAGSGPKEQLFLRRKSCTQPSPSAPPRRGTSRRALLSRSERFSSASAKRRFSRSCARAPMRPKSNGRHPCSARCSRHAGAGRPAATPTSLPTSPAWWRPRGLPASCSKLTPWRCGTYRRSWRPWAATRSAPRPRGTEALAGSLHCTIHLATSETAPPHRGEM